MLTNNISKSKLSGKNIGIYFGTFAPLHTGHQQQIYKCASLNDGVLLVVSGYDNDRGAQIGLPLEKRFRYLREAFNDEEIVRDLIKKGKFSLNSILVLYNVQIILDLKIA